jgi:N-acetylmuramoyl-L-alanine amidase
MFCLVVFVMCLGVSIADISGTTPATGSCLCASGSGINVRSSACGTVIGSISSGQCYEFLGGKVTCTLSGVVYDFYELDYGSSGGWVAGTYLNTGSASSCSVPAGCPDIVTRAEWGARAPTSITYISQPVPKVFIHHTEGSSCTTQAECTAVIQAIQDYHMDVNGWADIGYNFLVGEDGNAYEGRGWDRVGAHASDWNSVSIGMSVMGSFSSRTPNAAALNVLQQLIGCGVSQAKLSGSYTMHGHRDGGCTDCPGQAFYDLIQTWNNYGGYLSGCKAEDVHEFRP